MSDVPAMPDWPSVDWRELSVEQTGSKDFGPCPDCGRDSRTVWGTVSLDGTALAVYYVQWTPGSPQHGANIDIIVGKWGDGTGPEDRRAVCVMYRGVDVKPGFMVIDASRRKKDFSQLAGAALDRDQVIGSRLADYVFALIDAVFMKDDRIEEVRKWS